MTLIEQFIYCIRAIPRFITDGMDNWVMDAHCDRGDGTCRACIGHRPWPCRHFTEAAERRARP